MRPENTNKKHKITVRILVAVVAVLILFIAFFFVVQPGVSTHDQKQQIEGANNVIGQILNSVKTQGYIGIPLDENNTLNLVPVQSCAQVVEAQQKQAQTAPQTTQ